MPSLRGQRGGGVRLMALMGPAVLCLGAYVLMNWIAFDTWSPVSGQAKAFGPAFDNFSVLTGYLTWHPVPAPLLGGLETWHYLLLVLLTVTLTMVYLRTPAIGVLGRFVVSFVAANVMQVAYYASATSYPLWNWYYYYSPVILLLWLPLFALAVSYSFRSRVALPVTVLTCLLLTTVLARNLRYVHSGRPEVFDYQAASVAASKWLESRTPRSAVVAMGDRAGSFAYLLDRPVLQLEGLVNSTEYLEVLRDGRILTYMAGAGVDYYVRSGGATSGGWPRLLDLDDPAGPCSAVSEPKFGTVPRAEVVVCEGDRVYHKEIEEFDSESGFFSIWRYRPELNNESP